MPSGFSHIRLPISTRLALWYGLSLLLLLSLFVIFLYTSFHVSLHRDFEEQLRSDEARLREAVHIEGSTPVLQAGEALRSVAYLTDGAGGTYVRLLSPGGALLYHSPNFQGHAGFAPSLPSVVEATDISRTWQGVPARSRYAPLLDEQNALAGWLEVTRLESTLHHELHRLRWLLAVGILLGVAVAISSGYGLARRALRPVATMTGAAQKIQGEEPGHRLPTDFGVRDELTDLAETLNALLARLDTSLERERHFRANAAHEMFTPISAILSEIDVTLRKLRDAPYYEETLQTVRRHAQRLASIVEALLKLSRAEAIGHIDREKVNASEVTRDILERFRASAEARSVQLPCDLASNVPVAVDPSHLEAILENLLDNALKYTPPGGTVTVSTYVEGRETVLRITDTGIGFTEEEATRLFDRFYRSVAHPVQQVRGSGLGLSIAKAIVNIYRGHITAQSPGQNLGSTFEVRLPLAEPEGSVLQPVR